jgi:hypothetical protein
MVYKIILVFILIVIIFIVFTRVYDFFRRRKQWLAFKEVFKDFEGRTPKLKMYYLYSYPAFTITFKSEEDMVKAEEDGSLSQFSDAIQEICERPVADSTYQFDAKRAISVTYEGRVITYS